jgi:hypothetical protein
MRAEQVSIAEAWGDLLDPGPSPTMSTAAHPPPPSTVAVRSATDAHSATKLGNAAVAAAPPEVTAAEGQSAVADDVPTLLAELRALRREQERRSFVYIALAAILFALLLLYIDRLSSQLQRIAKLYQAARFASMRTSSLPPS